MIRFLQSGNKATKYLLAVLMTIIALSMVAYLIPGFMSGENVNRAGIVANVAGQEINTQDVEQYVGKLQQRQRYPEFMMPYLQQQAIKQLMQEAEIRYEGERMGLSVSDNEVRDALHTGQNGAMFFPDGKWIGQEKYEQLLQENGMSVDQFEHQVRLQLLASKLFAAVTAGITVRPSEIEQAYKGQNTKIKFDYAVISMDDVQKQIKPTDAELKAWFETNKARYQNSIPEKRQISYFIIGEQQVENKVSVTPTDIQQYYSKNQDQYRTQDRVRVRHILIATPPPGPDGKVDQKAVEAAHKKAEDVLKQLKGGADFAELAKKYSDDPGSKAQGGELGWQTKDSELVPEFKTAMLSLNKGQISDPVQTSYGFHIIQVEDKETAGLKPLSQVKDGIEKTVREQKIAGALDQLANQAQDAADKQGLDKAAAQYGTQVITTNPITRSDSLPGIGAGPNSADLMNAIFEVAEKTPPQSTRLPQGVVVFKVDKVIPPSSPDFEAIKTKVTNDFKAERASALLSQKTAELSERARNQHDLKKAARELGATVKTSDPVSKSSQVPDIGSMSAEAVSSLFTMKPGEISQPLSIGRNGVVAAILDRQEPPLNGEDFAKAKDGLSERLLSEKRQQAIELFLGNLEDRMNKEGKLKINTNEYANLTKNRS
jgi:peptidyl-prolyl cis-trans isomerase D